MTREQLSSYHDLSVRLHTLSTEIVGDTAKDYTSGFPHSIALFGLAHDDKTRKEVKLLREKISALDAYIDGIADVRAKNLLDMHYRKNMTWWQIAKRTGRSFTAEKQYLYNFLKKA
ncbi:hypothetical protein [Caproicibacterium sp. XB1]|uniref:hypothetical protein n=1 Tax=Caproicibacterium sp. XB1 TaxID=3396405 RepID=UPI0039B6F51E